MSELIYAHGVIIAVRRHVDLVSLLPLIALGSLAMRLLEAGSDKTDREFFIYG